MLLENRIYALWIGKQTAKGTPNATPGRRLVQVGGDFGINVDVGSENWSDLTKFGGETKWVNTVTGQGTPNVEATPTELAYLLWLFHGAETVTALPGASRHVFTPSSGGGHWATVARRIGQSVIRRDQYNDCRIGQVVIEASTGTKAARITPTLQSLDPGEVRAVDPAAPIPTDKPFLYTDGAGGYQVDTGSGLATFRGQSAFTLTLNEDLTPVYGDDVPPYDFAQGNATATIAATLLLDGQANAEWNQQVYGAAAPVAGAKPLARVAPIGRYLMRLEQKDATGAPTARALDLDASVQWTIPDYPGPNPDGGATDLAMSGTIVPPAGGGPAYTLGVETDLAEAAFTT